MRTKACRKIAEVRCLGVRPVYIGKDGGVSTDFLRVDLEDGQVELQIRSLQGPAAVTRFARRDGFWDVGEMRRWFEKAHGLPFLGLVIRW